MESNFIKDLNNSFKNNEISHIQINIKSPNENNLNKRNIINISSQNSENYLFSENSNLKDLYEKNNSNKLAQFHSSNKITDFSKYNRVNNNMNNQHLDLLQKNKYCNDYILKKTNMNFNSNNNKNIVEKDNNLNKRQKQLLNLNKKIKRERYAKKNYINIPKSINNKKDENKYVPINSFGNNRYGNYSKENNDNNKDTKSLCYNYSHENLHKGFSLKENDRNDYMHNSHISQPLKFISKKDKNGSIFNQYYSNIDISSYNQYNSKKNKNLYSNEIFDDSKILKKEIYLNNPRKNEYIINTFIYNSPIEQHNIINNKNYINSKENNPIINQKKNVIKENKSNVLISPKNQNAEKNKANDKSKSFVHLDISNSNKINKSQLKNNQNVNLNKITETNENIRIKKDIFYYLNPNIYRDELSFQNIKKKARTTKITLEENDIENKSVKIPINLNKINYNSKNYLTNNKKEKLTNQKLFETKIDKCKENHLNEFDSAEIDKLKISGIHANKKYIENKINNNSIKNNKNYTRNYNMNHNNNNSKQISNKYFNNDIRSVCVIDSRGNMNNNFIKISNLNRSPNNICYKKNKNLQFVIYKTDSGKKNMNISSREPLNTNKFKILNLKSNKNKKADIYFNNIDNGDSQNIENKDIKIIKKHKHLTENNSEYLLQYNKSIVNIRSNAPNTLFKSIKTGKNINNPSVITNQSGKEREVNYELLQSNISSKKISLYNQKNKNINNSNISKDNKIEINANNKGNKNDNINNDLNSKELNTKNGLINIYLDENNKNKGKNELNKSKKKIYNNYSENYIFEKNKNNSQTSNKKSNKKEINVTKSNLEGLKLNKNISEISTIEPIKNNLSNENNSYSNKKINSPKIKIQNNKIINKIYIKPNCPSPQSNKKIQTERILNKQNEICSRNKNNLKSNMKTSYNQITSITKKLYPSTSPKLKIHKSAKLIKLNNNNKENSYPKRMLIEEIIDENKIRENLTKKYCFIQKYIDYFIRKPLLDKCYIQKVFKNSSQINSDYFSKNRDELEINDNYDNDNENEFNKTFSVKNITFADNKINVEKTRSISKVSNTFKSEQKENIIDINNINNVIKKIEQIEILDDNFIDNDDIKLNYSDENDSENNSVKLYGITLGKEIEDSEKRITKTYKNIKIENNLENAEKGLKILRNIAEKRELKNNEEINSNNSGKKIIANKNQKIFLGTNKLNDLFNNRKEYKKVLTEGNLLDEEQLKISKYRFSKSLNKDLILKGISKIENLFEKKSNENFNSKINTYQKKAKNTNISVDSYKKQLYESEEKLKIYNNINNNEHNENSKEFKNVINNINIIKDINNDESDERHLSLNKNLLNNNKYNSPNIKLIQSEKKEQNENTKNSYKSEILYLLNIITVTNYTNILDKLMKNIIKVDGDDELINNENIFKDIIFNKLFKESKYIKLYSKLIKDLNDNISQTLKEQGNTKNNKEKSVKSIINEGCVNILNKFKNSQDDNYLDNYNSEKYFLERGILRNYTLFIYEFINIGLLKQQFGVNIIEQFYKKTKEINIKRIYKTLYLDACILLYDKIMEDIFKCNNKKLIQCLNNFIDHLSNDDNQDLPNYLRYKIINSVEKKKKMNEKEIEKIEKSNKSIDLFDKILEEEVHNKSKSNNIKMIQKTNISKTNDDYELIIQEDLNNYISYFSEKGDNGQTIIKTEVDKSYNWKIIDDLINKKDNGLSFIINNFIKACSKIITKENQVILSNDYIKNIIEYYINNLSKEEIGVVQNEMIKTLLNINDVINKNQFMYKILGNLLFILIENKLYHIKDFNNYLKVENNTKINLAIITRYCIISAGKFAKKYFNDFKQTKLFINNNIIFNEYVNNSLKELFYFFN